MGWLADAEILRNSLNKYKWVLFVIAIGLIMMLFPEKKKADFANSEIKVETEKGQIGLQQELEQILSRLDGAGEVKVLLTESIGQQTIYQIDQNTQKSSGSEEVQNDTVILNDADRSEAGLVSRIDPPRYLGAVVLCHGADKPTVRLAIVDAVSTATGLGSDRISVWKMK